MFHEKKYLNLLFILSFTISTDQITKSIAYKQLFLKTRAIHINEFLSMTPVWNNGISFGMFQDYGELGRFIFTVTALLISVWLIWSYIKLQKVNSIGYIFIAGGAIGNALDRIIYGKVIDFIDFHYENFHWPAFNLADIFIFVGVVLFFFDEFINLRKK